MNSPTELARLEVRNLAGVFAARQFGRGLAASLALDDQDQVRVATALSEVSRSVVTAGRTAVITFGVEPGELVLTVTLDGSPPADGISRGRPADGPGHGQRGGGTHDQAAPGRRSSPT